MTKKQWLLVGCGSVAMLFAGCVVLVGGGILYLGQDPAGISVTVEAPERVRIAEEFTLTVLVHNERTSKPFRLTDIDIADAYLDKFVLLATDPAAKSSMHVPLNDNRSFTFDRSIPAGESMRFDFRLRALEAGFFRGDADVYEGMRSTSALLQTEVKFGE